MVIILFFIAQAPHCLAKSSVWKISLGQEYFYIGGTIHLLSKHDHPLPPEFSQAYQDSQTLVFETDLRAIESAQFQSEFMAAIRYSGDRQLSSDLDAAVFQKLQAFLQARQLPLDSFLSTKPWGVSLILSVMEYQRLGMVAEFGVDHYFHRQALKDKKTVLGLETPQQQLQFLRSMENMDPNQAIQYTLRDLQLLPEFIGSMKQHWRTGDLGAFANNSALIQMKSDFPDFYEVILTQRNNAWMAQLPSFIHKRDRVFVLVGSLHLVEEQGLLQQLIKQGFKVKPL